MKPFGRRKRKAVEIPQENYEPKGAEEKKSANGNCRPSQEVPGDGKSLLLEKDQKVKPSCAAKSSHQCESLPERARVKDINPQTGEILSSLKMKLQLFPVNETTRLRLEKDGHNPFLELTLSARKKISSVIKHLNNKWGSSSAAIEELVLFPYNMRSEFSASKRWTSDNGGITAVELHELLESPAVFRLRYGWFPNLHSEAPGAFCASVQAPSESDNIGKARNSFSIISSCLTEKLKVDDQEIGNLFDIHKAKDVALTEQTLAAAPADHMGNEIMAHSAPAQLIVSWDDGLTSLSIGGLLSEASLLNVISSSTLKSDSKSGLQPILFSDISIGGLLHEASLQEKITNSKMKSENMSGLLSNESVVEISRGGLLSEVSFQNKIDNPDLKTQNEAGLYPIHLASEISIGALLSEASLQGKINANNTTSDRSTLGLQPLRENIAAQSLWDDGLTTLSIGGLLSEASLQARITGSDPQSEGNITNSHSRIPNFDSFDAFLADQPNSQPQVPKPALLDFSAEDTCHAFPFQELSSFSKDYKISNEGDNSRGYFNDSRSNTCRLPQRDKNDSRLLRNP